MEIGTRIKELRKIKEWSQDELCQRTGLKRAYISRVENGHTTPALPTLKRLAAAFRVSLSHLLDVPTGESYEREELPPVRVAQPQAGYQSSQASRQDVFKEIENAVEEASSELRRRIKDILQRRDF